MDKIISNSRDNFSNFDIVPIYNAEQKTVESKLKYTSFCYECEVSGQKIISTSIIFEKKPSGLT